MALDWHYVVELQAARLRKGADEEGDTAIVWSLVRHCRTEDGKALHENIISSADTFLTEEEARRDALIRLSMLRCPIEKPVDHAIKWLLNGYGEQVAW